MSHENYTFEIHANLERAYYAAFYAATALLLRESLEFSKHSGVIAAIHKQFIKTGKLERQFGKDLNWLFELAVSGTMGLPPCGQQPT